MSTAVIPETQHFFNESRGFAERVFNEVREISASPAPRRGVTRMGYSPVEASVLKKIESYGKELELEISYDAAGNLWMTLPGKDRTLPGILCGSHADSVLDGGNYDGLAGITAALLTAYAMRREAFTPERDFIVAALRCEEQGLIGSRAMMGKLTADDLARRWTPESPTLKELLEACGFDPARLTSGTPVIDTKKIGAFFELHIEQGVRLTLPNGPRVGLVTGIRGMVYHRSIHCYGEPAHAGAIDYEFRHDALAATMRLLTNMNERWTERVAKGDDLVFTTGILETDPTAIFNKIPGHVRFSLDSRTLCTQTRDNFYAEFKTEAEAIARRYGVRFEFDPPGYLVPIKADPTLFAKLDSAATATGIPVIHEPSGAGHDAQTFGLEDIPFAMIFVANQNGSHNPDEAMVIDDFLAGVAVLKETIFNFDK